MKANFKINKDNDKIKNEKMSTVERETITDEEFEKKGMNTVMHVKQRNYYQIMRKLRFSMFI